MERTLDQLLKTSMGISENMDLSEDESQDLYLWVIERYKEGCIANNYYQCIWSHAKIIKNEYDKMKEERESIYNIDSVFYNIALENVLLKEYLNKALGSLSEREKLVLQIRFIDNETLENIGDILNVSSARARQIEAKAIRKLRHCNIKKYLEGFL